MQIFLFPLSLINFVETIQGVLINGKNFSDNPTLGLLFTTFS